MHRIHRRSKVAHRLPGCCERGERIMAGNYRDFVTLPTWARPCRLCHN